MKKRLFFIFLTIAGFSLACQNAKQQAKQGNVHKSPDIKQMQHVDWSRNANIYEVNIRQYTKEGTLKAFQKHLARLQKTGVDILWLMPVYPIGEKNRKGSMGSYYSVRDYRKVNPEFGTLEDLKMLVEDAHRRGMHVILDWVANHTAWDNPWAAAHPDWYKKDSSGTFLSPFDWTDVIQLDYSNKAMRKAMIASMKYWIENANIDGFRCDVAEMVPVDFWEEARAELDSVKPVFMLAEAEKPELMTKAFDANYAWRLHFLMNEIVQQKKPLSALYDYFRWNDTTFPAYSYRMTFIDNHDENSWKGTVRKRLGDAAQTVAVFMNTIPGFPLIYSGQEAGLDKSLAFFEKDEIDWSDLSLSGFYQQLNQLKHQNPALQNGQYGGKFTILSQAKDNIFAFQRSLNENNIVVLLNLSNKEGKIRPGGDVRTGYYGEVFSKATIQITPERNFTLAPWEYRIYILKK